MTHYLARSPVTGAWFRAPGEGSTLCIEEAHPYQEDTWWLKGMVEGAKSFGCKLRLRQVHVPTPADPVHTDA